MKVMLADIDVDSLEDAVAELKKDQISVRGVECDVSDRTSVQRAAAETLAAFGKVHVVCNNAGPGVGGPLELTTPGDCDWIIGVDLMGTIYGCQTFLPHIKAHGEGGHIVRRLRSDPCRREQGPLIGPRPAVKARSAVQNASGGCERVFSVGYSGPHKTREQHTHYCVD